MAYGLRAFDATGALIFDTSTAGGGVVADLLEVDSGATLVKEYPGYAGQVCRAVALAYTGPYGVTVDTALGHPRVSVSAGLPRQILVTMA